ncbi:hypothetical protein E2C01_043263 [Portunus trituberculatus]|uniref:Serine/threonine-protein kinase D1-3-like ubiquitin-like domain-containing protein n=1 Tax=Portunus trituberculatus TaxID=210409 RepID=A0A5B7FPU1_PORTR|nr:hypothetical protein [Portunus trituberculatus]
MEVTGADITFSLQHGLVRDITTVNASQLTLKTLKDRACEFINTKCKPSKFVPERIDKLRFSARSWGLTRRGGSVAVLLIYNREVYSYASYKSDHFKAVTCGMTACLVLQFVTAVSDPFHH